MFARGDTIIGSPNNGYRVTCHNSVCEVIDVLDEYRMVVRLKRRANPYILDASDYVGQVYTVNPHKFMLEKNRTNKSVVGLLRKGDAF